MPGLQGAAAVRDDRIAAIEPHVATTVGPALAPGAASSAPAVLEPTPTPEQNPRPTRSVRTVRPSSETLAAFRELDPLEDFDRCFNPSIKRTPIYNLEAGDSANERRDALLMDDTCLKPLPKLTG